MTPIHLPVKQVARRALEAYQNNELQFQKSPETWRRYGTKVLCQYSGPCAIGVSLSPEDRNRLDKFYMGDTSIGTYLDNEDVATDDSGALIRIQDAHDTLLQYKADGHDVSRMEDEFLTLLKELAE